ncbi:uncharacterized protein [Salminus brasiliensis]|uniref:uncharacterized protein n=1 Tax=Salminus brasiliensis TaxID=930266 RepID=UPI003B832623
MHVRMAQTVTVAAVVMLLRGVQGQHSVTLSSQSLCAVTGSTVKISCKYTTPDSSSVREKEWYQIHSSKGEERVLSKNPEFRVSVSTWLNNCELTMRNVRVSDSGVYNFRFRTSSNYWISASSGVQLTVTDLQVKVDPKTVGQSEVKVTCSSTCSLGKGYNWYRNEMQYQWQKDASIILRPTVSNFGRYSCAVSGEKYRSPSVCVLGKECWGVTYTAKRVCALKGSSVDLSCSYKYPGGLTVTKSVWFIKEQTGAEPVDVEEDEEYQGRVQNRQSSQNHCSMRITDLRERDAQTYIFRFYTDGGEHTGQPGVTLSVTDLKVTVSYREMYLTCSSTCTLPYHLTYIWYKNGQPLSEWYNQRQYWYIRTTDAGNYSCAVRGYEELHSPAVCVLGKECWGVTYTAERVCALKGSSVDLSCSYKYPGGLTVTKSVWFIKEQTGAESVDVREDEEYQGRVQNRQSSQNDCSMIITDLRERDAQTYRFRFYTDGGEHTGQPGVTLSVTDLKVTVSYREMYLTCSSTCTLPDHLTYIWYKNGQPLSEWYNQRQYRYIRTTDAGNYSCAVRGYEELHSPAVYPPRNTRAVLVPSGERVEGESVTLSCSSDADPPVLSYSWFKQRAAADTPLTTGQNYSITNISSQHSGLYYCTVNNSLGQHNSTPTHLDVLYPPRNSSLSYFVTGDSFTLVCASDSNPASSYTWYNKAGSDITPVGNGTNLTVPLGVYGIFYCKAKNPYGSFNSSDWSITSDSTSAKYAASAVTVIFLLTFFAAFFWLRRRAAGIPSRIKENSGNDVSTPVYDNISAMTSEPTRTAAADDEDDVQYSSVHFIRSRIKEMPLFSTVQQPSALQQEEEVEYAIVNLVKKRPVRENEAPIYSTAQRT